MKYQERIPAIKDGITRNEILKYHGIKRKKKVITPAISFLDFFNPSSTGNVFISSARSPSISFKSRILETAVKKMIIKRTRPGGKATILLLVFTRKNPANITERQARLTKNEFNITNLFSRSGGLE